MQQAQERQDPLLHWTSQVERSGRQLGQRQALSPQEEQKKH